MQIQMLGGLQVVDGTRAITRFRSQRFAALLAYLAYYPERLHPRELLIELLWPETEPNQGRVNLRQALASLRRQLEPPGVAPGCVVRADRHHVQLNSAAVTTDVAQFETALHEAAKVGSHQEQARLLREAVDFYRGELLPGFTETWVLSERQRLLQAYLQALDDLVLRLEPAGRIAEALGFARRAVRADPLREEGQHTLIRLLAKAGQEEAALRQYRELERLLATELGLAPGEQSRALAVEIARGRAAGPRIPDQDSDTADLLEKPGGPEPESRPHPPEIPPPAAPVSTQRQAPSGFVPLQITRFFGREQEIASLLRWLGPLHHHGAESTRAAGVVSPETSDEHSAWFSQGSGSGPPILPGVRLVTLLGPGGSGKTRLALEVAARLPVAFGGAVWWVPLVDLADPRYIADRMLSALGLPRPRDREPIEQVIAFLASASPAGSQPALLLLDNLEHLLPGGAEVVRTLLERVPELRVLTTSRQALGLFGEQEFPVGPLPVPVVSGQWRVVSPESVPKLTTDHWPLTTLAACPSVQLFVDRAQAVRPDFQVTPARAAAVAQLCARLEGLPLALELAAARIAVLTPAQMLERLEQRFELLTSHGHPADPRHRSLRATLDWSYQLLSPELQRFFARLSVFHGSFTLEASEAIRVVEGSSELKASAVSPMNKLGSGKALDYLEQLRACSLVNAEEAGTEMRYRLSETLREYGWEQLQGEEERTAVRGRHRDWFLAIAEAFRPGAAAIQRLERDHDNLRAALFWAMESGELQMGMRAAYRLGSFCFLQGNWSEGREWLEALLAHPGSTAYPALRAQVLSGAASLAGGQRDPERARRYHEEALEIGRSLANEEIIAVNLQGLGGIAYAQGDLETARACHEENLAAGRALNNRTRIKAGLHGLGVMAEWEGHGEQAQIYYEELLAIYRFEGNEAMIAWCLHGLGVVALLRGDLPGARAFLEDSRERFQAIGHQSGIAAVLQRLGLLAWEQGDLEQAADLCRESLRLAHQFGDPVRTAQILNALAACAAARGRVGHAARVLGAAARLLEMSRIAPHTGCALLLEVEALRGQLGAHEFEAAWAAGQAAPLEEVIASALEKEVAKA